MRPFFSIAAATLVGVGSIVFQAPSKAAPPNGRRQVVKGVASPSATTPKNLYFNLRGYVHAVLAQDPGLIAARLAKDSNDKEAQSIRADYLPYLKADAEAGILEGVHNFGFFAPTTVESTLHNTGTGSPETVSEPVSRRIIPFDGYSVFGPTLRMPFLKDGSFLGINTPPEVNAKRAQSEVLAATARLDAQDVVYRATDLYLQAIVSSNEAGILRNHLDWLQKQTDLIHGEATHDLVSQADVEVADTKLAEEKIEILIAGQRAVDAFYRVCELLGITDPRTVRIDTRYPQANPMPSFDSSALRTNQDHPRIEMQQAETKKADAELALKRAQLYMPTGQIVSTYRFGNNLENVGLPRWDSFLALSAPIFDFGERYNAFKAAGLKLEEEKELVAKAHEQVRQDVFDAFTHLREVRETQTAIASLVAERQRTVDRLLELDKYQRAPIPELIKGQLLLLEAKRSEEGINYAVLLASAELEKATAGEWKWIR